MGSVVYQVKDTLQRISLPGVSRDELKEQGIADRRITSFSTMEGYLDICMRFAKHCEAAYGIERRSGSITPEMAEAYIQQMRERELSGGYIGKVKAAIRKLDAAMKERGWRDPEEPELLAPRGGWHSDRRPGRAYSPQEAREIIAEMQENAKGPQTADVVALQRVAGLRVSEATMIRGQDLDVEEGKIRAVKKGTKGGRPTVHVDEEHVDLLARLKRRAESHRDDHVFQGRGHRGQSLASRTNGSVRHACERLGIECYGTHGFRKTRAQERYRRSREEGLDERESRRELARGLGHNRREVTYSYVRR